MKTATVNFKTDEEIKRQAQILARIIGVPLGSILNAYLREFVASQEVYFSHPSLKKERTIQQIVQNLDESEKEELRKLLNKEHLRYNYGDGTTTLPNN